MKVLKYIIFSVLTFAISLTVVTAQTPGVKVSTEEELKADLTTGPCENTERLEAVKALFRKMGATDADIKVENVKAKEKDKDILNVVVTKKGKTNETVVVGAHYDKVKEGCGIIDNWSGIVILAHMYRTLSSLETQKTYVFVAFDREEEGMKGSAAMVKATPKETLAAYCSMVNLDAFGLGYPVILGNASSKKMVKSAEELAEKLKAKITTVDLTGIASSDSASFKDKDVPAITLSALSNKWTEFMHSPKDKFENVIMGSVRIGYHFSMEYLKKIDAAGCSDYK